MDYNSGYREVPNENTPNDVSNRNTANEASNQEIPVEHQRVPLVPIQHVHQQGQMHQTMVLVIGQLDFRDFHQVFLRSFSSAWQPQKKSWAYIIESDDVE